MNPEHTSSAAAANVQLGVQESDSCAGDFCMDLFRLIVPVRCDTAMSSINRYHVEINMQGGVEPDVVIVFNQNVQADKSGDLDTVEVFKLEHYVAVVRREYMESYDRRTSPYMTQAQTKKAVSSHSTASRL